MMDEDKTTRRARQMAPDERRLHLLEVAVKVFADKGLGTARHGDVARAAGVSTPTVHSYFKTRNDLINCVLSHVSQYVIERCIAPYTSGGTMESRMLDSGENLARLIGEQPEYFKVWVMWGAYFGEPFKSRFEEFETAALPYLGKLLVGSASDLDDADMQEKARVQIGLSIFLTQMVLRGENEQRQETFIRNVVRTLQIWID